MSKSKLKQIKEEIEEAQLTLSNLQRKLINAQKNSFFKCNKCGKKTKVKKITLFRGKFYISPYGCTGGDYWRDCLFYELMCLECGEIHDIDEDHHMYEILNNGCKNTISYVDPGGGTVSRRNHFKKLLQEN